MGDLSKNFSRSEFACKGENCCGHSAPMSKALIESLEELRALVCRKLGKNVGLSINSGFRCNKHNAETPGAAPDSRHPLGDGSDISCPKGLSVDEFYELANSVEGFKNGGIGKYSNRLHLDTRGYKARWDFRKS